MNIFEKGSLDIDLNIEPSSVQGEDCWNAIADRMANKFAQDEGAKHFTPAKLIGDGELVRADDPIAEQASYVLSH